MELVTKVVRRLIIAILIVMFVYCTLWVISYFQKKEILSNEITVELNEPRKIDTSGLSDEEIEALMKGEYNNE